MVAKKCHVRVFKAEKHHNEHEVTIHCACAVQVSLPCSLWWMGMGRMRGVRRDVESLLVQGLGSLGWRVNRDARAEAEVGELEDANRTAPSPGCLFASHAEAVGAKPPSRPVICSSYTHMSTSVRTIVFTYQVS